jgi:phage-related protein
LYDIEFYTKENGKTPVEEFMDNLNEKMRTKALREICLLREYGRDLREPHVKYMKNGIYELRIKTGSNISRVFYFFFSKKEIILTNGFIKKTEKTPPKEINKAIKYKENYVRRNSNEI